MPTQQQVQQTILSAQLIAASKTNENRIALTGGSLSVKWGYINRISRLTNAVLRQYNLQDYSSKNFLIVYDCLNDVIGLDTTVNTIDPNAQLPNTTIIVNTTGPSFQYMNKTQADLVLDSVSGNYYLPFLNNSNTGFPIGSVPISVELNGVQITPALDATFTPQRIYGFANNAPTQIITVTVAVP